MVGSAPTTGAIGACLLFAFVAVVGVHVSRATGLEGAQLEAGGSAPPTCPGFSVVEGTGTAVDPFQSSKQADASGCCSFCSTLGARCVAWTWHSTTGICFVSNFSTPHSSADATGATRTAPPTPVNPPLGYQPNIIFVLTDDQDTMLPGSGTQYDPLGSLKAMPQVQEYLIKQGATFQHATVATPICCPSRTESFTGRYFHNIGGPNAHCMHVDAVGNVFNTSGSIFSLMERAGYQTGVFGKVTNDQGGAYWHPGKESTYKAAGMTYIDSPIEYNNFDSPNYFRKFANGTMRVEAVKGSGGQPKFGTTYQTAQIGNRTLEWLDEVVGGDKPFFAYIGPHAPHYPAEPAPWHAHVFDDTLTAPRTPNYNVSSPGKAQHIRQNPPLSDEVKCWEDQHMRDRWASLRAVDDVVKAVIDKLSAAGVLDKTFIFYSSDHGYKLGQFRVGTSKQHPFETDIRVPLLVRGPGVEAGSAPAALVGNVDMAPTWLALAGAQPPSFMDGKSLLPFLVPSAMATDEAQAAKASWRTQFLIEYQAVGTLYNDHSSIWHDSSSGPTGKWTCGAGNSGPKSPTRAKNCVESSGVGDGNCWFIDSEHSNSWRALRIVNATHNLMYTEYDPTWQWNSGPGGEGLQFFELYDVAADPYQMTNIYNSTSAEQRVELHSAISTYFQCSGASCN